jgi:hypothetical protein
MVLTILARYFGLVVEVEILRSDSLVVEMRS